MTNARSAHPQIVVSGGPRLLSELLTHVLARGACARNVERLPSQSEPALADMSSGDWLIRFLGTEPELEPALASLTESGAPNLMLLSSDGHALVHRANRSDIRRANISLDEILEILNVRQEGTRRGGDVSRVHAPEEDWTH